MVGVRARPVRAAPVRALVLATHARKVIRQLSAAEAAGIARADELRPGYLGNGAYLLGMGR